MASGFPKLQLISLAEGPNHFVRFHWDTRLPDGDDQLFHWPGLKAQSA